MVLKDEKKHHGAVDESPSEQHFRKSDMITFHVWSHTPSLRQSDKILKNF